MKAIKVKYISATNTKGSRTKATDGDGNSVTLAFDYSLNDGELFKATAVALCKKMDWDTDLVGGGYKNDHYFVFKNQG